MALEERDREDLLRDGRRMPFRGEFLVGGVPVVIGFRRQGQASLYCGADPVFQFNAERQLRRLYFEGRRFAAQNGRLIELHRETRGGRIQLVSSQVDSSTQTMVLSSWTLWLQQIRHAAHSPTTAWRIVDGNSQIFRERLLDWLEQISSIPEIADSPNA